jgi:hypothetical protein
VLEAAGVPELDVASVATGGPLEAAGGWGVSAAGGDATGREEGARAAEVPAPGSETFTGTAAPSFNSSARLERRHFGPGASGSGNCLWGAEILIHHAATP